MDEKEVRKGYEFVETVPANRISWGAILGGTAIALFTQLLLTLLGIAIGLTALEPGERVGEEAGIGTAIYLAIATIISVFAGAWAAGRFSGLVLKNDGILHGIATLALTTLISLVALSIGLGAVVDSALTHGISVRETVSAPGSAIGVAPEGTTPEERTGAAAPLSPTEQERADEYSTAAAWTAFITGILALIAAAIGGVMGMKSRPIKDEHRPLTI
ncbi:MAG: hypothetical protein A2Y25_05550 [Candidatus Melainabacteria bacterium GWF2_37_15]|nr:MAG: hypothetical protein A2Y25_05550 [Candidatus Melainabacteria bacterium GWF2_37_15]